MRGSERNVALHTLGAAAVAAFRDIPQFEAARSTRYAGKPPSADASARALLDDLRPNAWQHRTYRKG